MHKQTREDYLRAIFTLHENCKDKKEGIKSVDIANFLQVTKASVSQMLKKLSEQNFIEANPYSNVFLTKQGELYAKKITHNFRMLKVFLQKVLGYRSLKQLTDEAHNLEHAFSDGSIKRLDKFLNNPKKCPHGKIIHK